MDVIKRAENLRVLLLESAIRSGSADASTKQAIGEALNSLWNAYMEGQAVYVKEHETLLVLDDLATDLAEGARIIITTGETRSPKMRFGLRS